MIMSMDIREVVAVVEAPEISLSESEEAGYAFIKFFEALGWDRNSEILDPSKILTTKCVFDRLYDVMLEKCPDTITVGMYMVNIGPGVDDDVPPGKVYLLRGWTVPDEQRKEDKDGL